MVLGLNIGLSQDISNWCIIQISVVFQAQIFIVPNVSQQMYQFLKFTLPGLAEHFANLCTAKLKYTLVDNKYIKDPMQAL